MKTLPDDHVLFYELALAYCESDEVDLTSVVNRLADLTD